MRFSDKIMMAILAKVFFVLAFLFVYALYINAWTAALIFWLVNMAYLFAVRELWLELETARKTDKN